MTGMSISKIMNRVKVLVCTGILIFLVIGCGKKLDNEFEGNKTEENSSLVSQEENEQIEEKTDNQTNEEKYVIDWTYYEAKLDKEDQEEFHRYLSVLEDSDVFFCFDWLDREININEYLDSIEASDTPEIAGVAMVDFDNNNVKELVIHFYEGGGNYLILTEDDEAFYGINFGERFLEELQEDGKYMSSGGAGDLYFYTLQLGKNGAQTTLFGELHGEESEDGTYGDKLEVNGQIIDNAQEWIDTTFSNPVNWVE